MFTIFVIILILFAGLYVAAIAPEMSRKNQMKAYSGTMFAHRGYHCIEHGIPENSIPAFKAAIQRGYGIELDVHLTRDNRLVVFHDDTLKRMCGKDGVIEQTNTSDLKELTLLDTPCHIPLLEEVLCLTDGQVPLLIELKMPGADTEICRRTYDLLKHYHGNFLVQSFNSEALRWFYRNAPHILRGQLSSNLVKDTPDAPYVYRFLVKHLLTNFWGKPDFISYKLTDLSNPSALFLRKVMNTPFAVWTLRNHFTGRREPRNYDMEIFEKSAENY